MARPRTQPETAFDRAIQELLDGSEVPPPLFVPATRKPGSSEVVKVRPTQIESIRDTVLRIQQDADPIGFLVAVQQGAMFEVVEAEQDPHGGITLHSRYVQATLKQRIDTAKYLAGKVLPSLSVQKVVVEDNREGAEDRRDALAGEPGQPTFAQIVAAAASKVQDRVQMLPSRVVVTEPVPQSDGRPVYGGSAGEGLDEDDGIPGDELRKARAKVAALRGAVAVDSCEIIEELPDWCPNFTRQEWQLVGALIARYPRVLSPWDIEENILDKRDHVADRSLNLIRTVVSHINKKTKELGLPKAIQSVWGCGYRLSVEFMEVASGKRKAA